MKNQTMNFPVRRNELQMLIDALEVLSPDNDKAESLRIHLLQRLFTLRATGGK